MISEYSELGHEFLDGCAIDSGFQKFDVPQEMVEEIGRRIAFDDYLWTKREEGRIDKELYSLYSEVSRKNEKMDLVGQKLREIKIILEEAIHESNDFE